MGYKQVVHLLENVLAEKWCPTPSPHLLPASWDAGPRVEVVAETDRAGRWTEPRFLTTWRAQAALGCPQSPSM